MERVLGTRGQNMFGLRMSVVRDLVCQLLVEASAYIDQV